MSICMSSRQTQSFLIERMKEAGIRPLGQHGQNFLIDLNLLDLIVRTADPGAQRSLEAGTFRLAHNARLMFESFQPLCPAAPSRHRSTIGRRASQKIGNDMR